ncbi:MAG: hypothetical protein K2Q18_06065 [Bdellovibrionales bacterium]|nr:hypothetical protein [Bdellovibrionales bacterium]
MDFAALQTLLASLALLQQQVVDAQALVDQAYQKGFADGVASVGSDKIYSQAEVEVILEDAIAPLQKKIEDLEFVVAGMDQKIADAIIAFKAELLVKVKEVDAIEDAALEALLV